MKNQYFGDINDYRKYGLLRILSDFGRLKTAVCWMLTPNCGSTDGKFTNYLDSPYKYQSYDLELFDKLKEAVAEKNERNVYQVKDLDFLPNTVFIEDYLYDSTVQRRAYFEEFKVIAEDSDILFFDPDNGIEVKSVGCGNKNSSKYIYWKELIEFNDPNKSLLIYQHFPRVKREEFINKIANEIRDKLNRDKVISFITSNVVFFFISGEVYHSHLDNTIQLVNDNWRNQFIIVHS